MNDVQEVHFNEMMDDSDHVDYKQYPLQENKLIWEDLNQDFYSRPRKYQDIEYVAKKHSEEHLDLRPYMIERPYTMSLYDKFTKVINLFKQMQLRQIPIVSDKDGKLQGIITR